MIISHWDFLKTLIILRVWLLALVWGSFAYRGANFAPNVCILPLLTTCKWDAIFLTVQLGVHFTICGCFANCTASLCLTCASLFAQSFCEFTTQNRHRNTDLFMWPVSTAVSAVWYPLQQFILDIHVFLHDFIWTWTLSWSCFFLLHFASLSAQVIPFYAAKNGKIFPWAEFSDSIYYSALAGLCSDMAEVASTLQVVVKLLTSWLLWGKLPAINVWYSSPRKTNRKTKQTEYVATQLIKEVK